MRSIPAGVPATILAAILAPALVAVSICAVPAGRAESAGMQWPLRPGIPVLTRAFDAPTPDWQRGHRGVDLAGVPGQPVYAAGGGIVVFAGTLAGRPLVSVAHPGGLRTSYEPVEVSVRPGQPVAAGTALGRLQAGHPGCPVTACLHWGAMWGPAAHADYVDPVGLLATTPIRLKPVVG